jgi:DNA-binding transcriptional regulator GbsR (MarR family)
MNQCTDVDAAIRRLERKIDAQNTCCEANKKEIASIKRRLEKLEANSSKELKNNNNQQSLTDIYKRLAKLESYCLSIENLFKQIEAAIEPIVSIFK